MRRSRPPERPAHPAAAARLRPPPPRSYSYDSGGAASQAPPPGANDRHYEAQQRNLREDLGGVIFREPALSFDLRAPRRAR